MKPFPSGLGVALVTPFQDNGEVDFDALDLLVDYVTAGGVDYLVALGTTAETPTLFPDERKAVLNRIRRRNGGRLPLVAGMGGNNTAAVVQALQEFDLEGVSAVLSVTPYYNKPSQAGLYAHYRAIAEASPVPVLMYNVPGRTGVNMQAETTLRLARDAENIIGIKEAGGDMKQIAALTAGKPDGFHVISGDDNHALGLIGLGGDGLISVEANVCPRQMAEMIAAALAHEEDYAEEVWQRIAPLGEALFAEGNPAGVKAALASLGILRNRLRLPLVGVSEGLYARISQLMRELNAPAK